MQLANREEFDQHLKRLCAGFNVPATPERIDAYWSGLARMNLSAFVRAVEFALGEHGPDKIPTPKQCWGLSKQSAPAAVAAEMSPNDQRAHDARMLGYVPTEWQCIANKIGMRFATCFRGDKALAMEGWRALRQIASDFEDLAAAHDPEATERRMQSEIINAFRRIVGTAPRSPTSTHREALTA